MLPPTPPKVVPGAPATAPATPNYWTKTCTQCRLQRHDGRFPQGWENGATAAGPVGRVCLNPCPNLDLMKVAGEEQGGAPWTRYPVATTEDIAEMTPNWVRADLMSAIADGHRDADPATALGESERGSFGEPEGESRPSVLLVEDDGVIAHMYELGLTLGGYPVRLANSGESALTEASKDSPPDVIVLDLELPAMSGLQMLVELRHRPATLHVPVIVLSNSDVDFSEAYRNGATQCHSKYRTTPQALVDYVRDATHAAA